MPYLSPFANEREPIKHSAVTCTADESGVGGVAAQSING